MMRAPGSEPSEPVCDMVPLAAMSSLCFWAACVRVVFTFTAEQPTLARSALTSWTTRATVPDAAGAEVVAPGFGAAVVGSGAAVEGFGAAVVGFGAAVVGPGAAVVGSGAVVGVVVGREAGVPGAAFAGFRDGSRDVCDGSRSPGSVVLGAGVPDFEGLGVAAGVSDGTGEGLPCCWPLHWRYQSGPPHRSWSAARAESSRLCRSPPPGQSVQAMATEGMPMTPTAIAVTIVRRYCL
ncbi:hypothetical protein GCM10010293_38780 [Streptomyces griseoflavus]|nr:hypothetical protein GCM10010293_38780 [Streptomyces griseoflavus]